MRVGRVFTRGPTRLASGRLQRRFEDYRKGHFVHGHRDGKVYDLNGLARLGAGWKSYAQARCRGLLPATKFPTADLFVMNPPFISVIAQTAEQKAQLRSVIGDKAASRGDYSMAFVTKALDSLIDGGAMGTLFPANLLVMKHLHPGASGWQVREMFDCSRALVISVSSRKHWCMWLAL